MNFNSNRRNQSEISGPENIVTVRLLSVTEGGAQLLHTELTEGAGMR